MRLSADKHHPDYHPVSIYATVFVDDWMIVRCVRADEEAGIVERLALDDDGSLIVDGDTVRTEVLTGVVRIDVPDDKRHLLDAFPFGPVSA